VKPLDAVCGVLANDESSTDQELSAHLAGEFDLDRDSCAKLAQVRWEFLRARTPAEELACKRQVQRILNGCA
jgi:hypothetical protein